MIFQGLFFIFNELRTKTEPIIAVIIRIINAS
jgi:hypothetical protein